ncbi:MAG: GNAT family N-acetyltransferase [Nitrososphaeraceae archaeon]
MGKKCTINQKKIHFDEGLQQYIIANNTFIYSMTDDSPTYSCFPRINGSLVNLRELSIEDAMDISRLMTYNVSRSLWEVPYPYTVENALNFINSSHRDFKSLKGVNFAIQYKYNPEGVNRLVGIISLKNIDHDNKKANLGYWLGELYWGHGIATESVALVINYSFSVLGLKELYAYVYSKNKASIRVLEKNGMTEIGEVNEYNEMSGRYQYSVKFVIQRRHILDKSKF